MCKRLFFLVFAMVSLLFGPALAQGRTMRGHGREDVIPLDRILPQIRSGHPGKFYDAEGPYMDPSGRLHYRIKWLTPGGRIVWLDTDARTGRILGVNHGWGGFGPYPGGDLKPPREYLGYPPDERFEGRVPWNGRPGWHGPHGPRGPGGPPDWHGGPGGRHGR